MNYQEKIKSMSDSELDDELARTIEKRTIGYQMLKGKDLLVEASIKL